MNDNDKKFLLELARASIRAKLCSRKFCPEPPESEELHRPCGAFVTLKTSGCLRGCIGNIRASRPLHKTIEEMAVCAATQDPRFPPMREAELAGVSIEISVLSPFEKVSDPNDIKVGRDGLYITQGVYSGLLLPQVPVEWGWDTETFLSQTCCKACLPKNAWRQPDTEIFKFTADVFGEEE